MGAHICATAHLPERWIATSFRHFLVTFGRKTNSNQGGYAILAEIEGKSDQVNFGSVGKVLAKKLSEGSPMKNPMHDDNNKR